MTRVWKVRERVTMERIVYVRADSAAEAKDKARDSNVVGETDLWPVGRYTYPGRPEATAEKNLEHLRAHSLEP